MAFAIRKWSQYFCCFPAHILPFCSYLQSPSPLTRFPFSRVLGTGIFQICTGIGQLLTKGLQPWRCFLVDRGKNTWFCSLCSLWKNGLLVFFFWGQGKQTFCKDLGSDSSPFTQSSVSGCQTGVICCSLWYNAPKCELDQDTHNSLQQPRLY